MPSELWRSTRDAASTILGVAAVLLTLSIGIFLYAVAWLILPLYIGAVPALLTLMTIGMGLVWATGRRFDLATTSN